MKKLSKLLIILLLIVPFSFKVEAVNTDLGLINGAKAGILIEESTGEILYEKNIHEKLSPASMTKIMTLLLTFESIEERSLSFDTILTASKNASSMTGSHVYLSEGEKMSIDEALKCICIASANDVAVMVAEYISGTEALFVNKMNEKAKALGCKNTLFSDCTGLSENNHYTSAYDVALISKELTTKYPKVLEYTRIKEDYIRKDSSTPFWLVNTNKLAGRVDGINGLKSGYISFSGYCITFHMTQNNMNLISVVFGYTSASLRNTESLELLKYGFSNYELYDLYKKDDIVYKIDSIIYIDNQINFKINEDAIFLVKKQDISSYSYKYEQEKIFNNTLKIYYKDELVKEIDIITESKRKSYFKAFIDIIKNVLIY